jgi:protein-tyrosine phosphatase
MAYQPVFWIESPVLQGKLGIMARPRGDVWLSDDLGVLKQHGVEMIVSLLTDQEARELQLLDEAVQCAQWTITFVGFPIPDRATPPWTTATWSLLRRLSAELRAGKTIVIHCRMGIGRSATLAAALLTCAGIRVDDAFDLIQRARGVPVPDTSEQKSWVKRFGEAYRTGIFDEEF